MLAGGFNGHLNLHLKLNVLDAFLLVLSSRFIGNSPFKGDIAQIC